MATLLASTCTTLVASVGYQATATSITATSDGLTTGLIPSNTSVVTVTSDDANKIITLPAPVTGMRIRIKTAATGCELRTVAASNVTINDVDSDGTNELALAANTVTILECLSATAWLAHGWTNGGVILATLVPDSAA